jgi:NADH-quinone oxidoreductase subunit H
MNEACRTLLAFAVWPGLLVAAPLGWIGLWFMRKATARLQGRRGPPFGQPAFDFVKLLGKEMVLPVGVSRTAFLALPLVSVASVVAALAILPLPGNPIPSLPGDVILLLYLLEVPVLIEVLAGYVSRSVYGQVAAMREALLSLGYNLPFLVAIIVMAQHAGSFEMRALAAAPFSPLSIVAGLTFLLALPGRLKTNPFSIPNAEHEIVADALVEYSGPALALFKLTHGLEIVLLSFLFAVVFIPATPWPALSLLVYLLVALALLASVVVVATATARLRPAQAFRLYWAAGGLASAATLSAALVW